MSERQLVSTWEMMHKDNDGEAHVTELHKYDEIPDLSDVERHFITQAPPVRITPTKRRKPSRPDQLTLAAGDAQIGYRGGEPFHSEHAMEMFQTAVRELQPDNIVLTGDMVDLPAQGKYEQRSDWQNSTQASIDRFNGFLAQLRANAPDAKIAAVHGNHELRQESMLRRDAAELLGLRRANAEKELGVLTLQYLCRYDELEVEGVDGYPRAAYWLEDNLKVMHGTQTKRGGATAASYLRSEDESTIFGHDHRLQIGYRTIAQRLGHRTILAASPGCLADIDGRVPGRNYSTDEHNRTVLKAEDWQNGLLVITHSATSHDVTPVRITEDGMNIWGRHYDHG